MSKFYNKDGTPGNNKKNSILLLGLFLIILGLITAYFSPHVAAIFFIASIIVLIVALFRKEKALE